MEVLMRFRRHVGGRALAALVAALAVGSSITPVATEAQGALGTVRGTVTNSGTGAPLANVQIAIPGTTLGAITNASGTFTLASVPVGNQIARARLIGYQPLDKPIVVTAGAITTVTFALTVSALSLDELVITGTGGSARKREVGNSIAQIKLADIPEVPTNVTNLLSGRLAGVTVGGGVGNAGSGAAIRLRGTTSVSLTNQPLIFIDGVRTRSDEYPRNGIFTGTTQRGANSSSSPLNDINPDDIDRIEIVKGAAAATLYGTDAAAGVIQIFTKRGVGGAAKWQVRFNGGVSSLRKFGTDSVPLLYMDPFLRNGEGTGFIPGLDNYAARYGTSIQVSGGSGENLKYLLSTNIDNTDGVLPNDKDRKYQVRANLDFQPMKKLAMNWSSAYTNNLIDQTRAGNNAQGLTLNAFRQDRNYFGNANPDTIRQVLQQQLATNIDRLIMGVTGTFTPFTRFSSRFTVGFDRAALENRNVRPFGFPAAPFGVIQNQRWSNVTLSTDWVNNYDFNLGSSVKVTASAGTQYVNSQVGDVVALSQNFATPSDPTVASGAIRNADENRQRIITGGAFGTVLFGVKNRYFVTVGGRLDGNSAFGQDFGLQFYPKINASWVVSDESFWKEKYGTLKLRGALGSAGRAPGAFAAVRTYSPIPWGSASAVRPLNLGNAELGPERTTEVELGFDQSLFSGRTSVDFTYFNATTTDALFSVRSVPSEGFLNTTLRNVGEMQKSGVELALNHDIITREKFGLKAGINFSTNVSNVVSLGGAPAFSVGNSGWVVEGKPAAVVRGKLIRNPDARGVAPDTVSNYDFGPSQPTRIIGGNVDIRGWKNIRLSVRGEYQGGAFMEEQASFAALSRSVLFPTCFDAFRNIAAGQPITVRETLTCIPANVRSDMFIFKADFFRIRDISLTVPLGKLIPRTASSTFVFSAQNIFRSNFGMPLFDPEMTNNDSFNAVVRGINEQIPAPAVFLMSLRISY
ncbi:TonB-dependent receptor domain-containing protein [Gemmatimonas sp.]|uniref:TonB-dependent receptor domain-containing protein n=1 Tax=Gemmatimonas sp. TaxID=1962908 RepID=UPI00356B0CAF